MPKNKKPLFFKDLPIEVQQRIARHTSPASSLRVATTSRLFSHLAKVSMESFEKLAAISSQNIRIILEQYGKKGIELLRKNLISPEQLKNMTDIRLSHVIREDLLIDRIMTAEQALAITDNFGILLMLDREKLQTVFEKNLLTPAQINELSSQQLYELLFSGFYALENRLITIEQIKVIPEDKLDMLFYKDCELLKKDLIKPQDINDMTYGQFHELITRAETESNKTPKFKV